MKSPPVAVLGQRIGEEVKPEADQPAVSTLDGLYVGSQRPEAVQERSSERAFA
jgi:hypothetical protein